MDTKGQDIPGSFLWVVTMGVCARFGMVNCFGGNVDVTISLQ